MKKKQKKRTISAVALSSAMLLNVALPQSAIHAHAESKVDQNSSSDGKFTANEVNRILAGLTPEQKASINKLTGAEDAQKIHVDKKTLQSGKNIEVIVQFKVDPAKIQIIKQSLANGSAYAQTFSADYSEAKQKVSNAHAKFKAFVNNQPNNQIIGGKKVSTDISITREYTDSFNGVALSIPADMVEKIASQPDVASVWENKEFKTDEGTPSTGETSTATGTASTGKPTAGLSLLGIDKLHAEGNTGKFQSGPRKGQRVKVGVLDTGIDYNHPDLYKVTHDENGKVYEGHDFVNSVVDSDGNEVFVDDHDAMETIYPDWEAARKANPGSISENYKDYITEHGTHVSGTIAASTTNNSEIYSADGVAPDVELHGYRVLGPGGHGSSYSVLSGIEQSVKDKMDVINLSLGSTNNDPLYPTSVAINNATLQGVIASVSAGNAGPGVATVGSPGTSALAITVGASTVPEQIPVQTLKFGNTPYQARLFGKNFADADDAFKGLSIPIVDVGSGTPSDYAGKDMSGKIALVKRGGDTLNTKMANAKDSGAKGMIIWNNQDDADTQGYNPNFLGISADNIYSVSITQAQGQALVDAIKADPGNAKITFPMTLDKPIDKDPDQLASFSSTGPVKDYTIKPDVVAPGVDIWSTVPYDYSTPNSQKDYKYSYASMSGTSMAAPHVTGISALVLAAHPDYTPADVKTALMNTAKDVNTDSKTYSVYQVGAGRVDPVRAIHSDIKIQVLDKTNTLETSDTGESVLKQIDDITGSMFFGFKGRGEGAPKGSDDVISSKDFNVVNQGTGSKTFNLSTEFISTKFAESNKVGPGTGNDVKIVFSTGESTVNSITVGGGNTVKTTAKITVPSNALEGTYEGDIHVVNAADSTESYRIPFTITIATKGIDFKVDIKAFTMTERYSGNYNPNIGGAPGSGFTFSVNGSMESAYLLLKDKDGNYLGVVQNPSSLSSAGPGVIYGPIQMLVNGLYLPFTKQYDGTLSKEGIATTPVAIKEGAYSVEMIATDSDGRRYTKEDTVYVDYTAPTMKMDSDSQPGIYEIDPTGYQSGQEIKRFYGTVYDSNIDIMKQNGETSLKDNNTRKAAPVDQGQNAIWVYEPGPFVTKILSTDANGRFYFGVAPEDVTSKGSKVWFYPSDYAGAGDLPSTKKKYYFIKKGSPYVTVTSSGGVDLVNPEQGSKSNIIVEPSKAFKVAITTKNGKGMTGGQFSIDTRQVMKFSNIKLSDEYLQYLSGKGITPTLTVGNPYMDQFTGRETTDITISGISNAGALDQDMKILEADLTYINDDSNIGPLDEQWSVSKSSFVIDGKDTVVPAFDTNIAYMRSPYSQITGGLFAEGFLTNNLSGAFANITKDSGAKVTVKDADNNTYLTDNPTTPSNTMEYFGNTSGTYSITAKTSDKPYSVETYMPGHFKGYQKTPVIGDNRYLYQSGDYFDFADMDTPTLLGGDVNGDDVIDMKDLTAEITAFYNYKNLISTSNPVAATLASKTAYLNDNRSADINWIKPGSLGYGLDYTDFYFIFKNFGKQNQGAIDAGKTVSVPQLKVDQDQTISTPYGGSITLNKDDGLKEIMRKLNFAGPTQKTSVTQLPTLQDLKNGSSVTFVPTSNVFLDDTVWRNAITKVELGLNGNFTDVTNAIVPNSSDKAVTISAGYYVFDPTLGPTYVPSKIKLNGSLFNTTGTYTVRITADGYAPVTNSFTIASVPIATPAIPMVTDPAKAHLGKDITFNYSFADDANWRNGINKIVVKTNGFTTGLDITNLKDNNGNLYYDISQPGQITFKANLFRTNATLNTTNATTYNAAINPGGTYDLPQQYKFEINSTGLDGTIYPTVAIGADSSSGTAAQPIGYGITFDTKGGNAIDPFAVGMRPARSRYGSQGFTLSNSGNINPLPVKSGYTFARWYIVDPNTNALTTLWDANTILTGDIKVAAKWQVAYTQNNSPVDRTKPDGAKFSGTVLGEGPLQIKIPDYKTNNPWLTSKNDIDSIEATYNKMKADGTFETTTTKYTLDPSTYNLVDNGDSSGTLTFTTATEAYAIAHPTEKFAFGEAADTSGYQLTLTSKTGEKIDIPNVKLGYRRHIDLNGGTLKFAADNFFEDKLVFGKASGIDMTSAASRATNGTLSMMPKLYSDAAGSSDKVLNVSTADGIVARDNQNWYISWVKTPPQVSKDVAGNVVGSDLTLPFTDDGTWRNNIKSVSIGSRVLVLNTDYKITYDSGSHKGSITLDKSLFTAGQKVNVTISSEGYVDAIVTDQIIGYTVTFESNGGDSIDSQIVDSRVTIPTEPSKAGYKFMGWYSDQALTTPYDFTSVVTKPIKLYAKYALATSIVSPDSRDNALGNDITLEFSDKDWANAITSIKVAGSVIDPTMYKIDATHGTLTIDQSVFKKLGSYTISISATDYADVTVSQKIVNGYKIHFALTGEKAPFEVKDQIVVSRIAQPAVHGYELTWFTDEDCTIPWDFTTSIYSAKTLYGKWKAAKYTVIYNTQDAGLVMSVKAEFNSLLDAPKPTRTGYTFLGWYKDAEGKTAWNFETDKVSDDMILYAKWSINSYTIHYNSNGGSQVADKTANYDSVIDLPKPTRTGYTFVGWFTDDTLKTPVIGSTFRLTSDITLYAKWSINSYTIHFNSNGGSQVNDKTANYDSVINLPKPTRTGYTFVGWYTDAALKTAVGPTVKLTSNITLYAKWNINTYTVKFNSNGGSSVATKTVNYNSTVSQPASPTRKGYVFLGWYKDAGKVAWNFAKDHVTANTTIYAKWEAIPAKPSNVKATKSGTSSVKLTWSSVSGAAGYEIVKSTSKTGSYTHLSDIKSASYTVNGLIKGKTYYYKVRSFKIVGSKKIYSDWSSVIAFKR